MLLAYEKRIVCGGHVARTIEDPIQRCCVAASPMARWQHSTINKPQEATITAEAKASVVDLACRKADLGYCHDCGRVQLSLHAREHGPQGQRFLARAGSGRAISSTARSAAPRSAITWNAADAEFEQEVAEACASAR